MIFNIFLRKYERRASCFKFNSAIILF